MLFNHHTAGTRKYQTFVLLEKTMNQTGAQLHLVTTTPKHHVSMATTD